MNKFLLFPNFIIHFLPQPPRSVPPFSMMITALPRSPILPTPMRSKLTSLAVVRSEPWAMLESSRKRVAMTSEAVGENVRYSGGHISWHEFFLAGN